MGVKDKDGRDALIHACLFRRTRLVKLLLNAIDSNVEKVGIILLTRIEKFPFPSAVPTNAHQIEMFLLSMSDPQLFVRSHLRVSFKFKYPVYGMSFKSQYYQPTFQVIAWMWSGTFLYKNINKELEDNIQCLFLVYFLLCSMLTPHLFIEAKHCRLCVINMFLLTYIAFVYHPISK